MIIGLTGGIAAGKSTVSRYLAQKGIPIVDADKISLKVMGKDMPCCEKIKEEFGKQFFIADNRLDRQALAIHCFKTEELTQKLNSIVHPFIFEEIDKQLEQNKNAPLVILDAPLLIETGLHKRCDKVMVVVSRRRHQILRAIKRSNISKMEVMKRIKRQMPEEEKITYADFVIKNNTTIEKLYEKVDKVLKELNYE